MILNIDPGFMVWTCKISSGNRGGGGGGQNKLTKKKWKKEGGPLQLWGDWDKIIHKHENVGIIMASCWAQTSQTSHVALL